MSRSRSHPRERDPGQEAAVAIIYVYVKIFFLNYFENKPDD